MPQSTENSLNLNHPLKCTWVTLFYQKSVIALFYYKSATHPGCTFFELKLHFSEVTEIEEKFQLTET
jgi:hypothetical protein